MFDGHGGHSCAQFLKANLLSNLLQSADFPSNLPEALRQTYFETDRQFHVVRESQRRRRRPESPLGTAPDSEAVIVSLQACQEGREEPSGSTAVTAVFWGREIWLANAGDSRAVLCRKGKAVQLTRDHRPDTHREEVERVEQLGGYICSDGFLGGELAVTRALGDWHLEDLKEFGLHPDQLKLSNEPEVFRLSLGPDDEFLVIACDGLWDVLSNSRVIELAKLSLRDRNDPQVCAEELVDAAKKANATDNITASVGRDLGGGEAEEAGDSGLATATYPSNHTPRVPLAGDRRVPEGRAQAGHAAQL